MNCNCNNINNTDGSGLTAYISHVYGNVLRLAIPLTLRTVTMENGEMVATDTDFIPSSDYPVTVVFSKGGVKISLEATMQNGNIAYIEDLGTIPVGKYDIAVLCKDDNGNPYRFKQVTALHIVDATADANIPSDIEYEVTTWYLDAAIFLALKGEDGVGIDDIITESSGEIGGMNTVTIVLTNGETRTFTVMNGSGQVDSDFNINSPHPLSNSTITSKFNAIDSSIDGLFGGVEYDSQSKAIRFYNKDRSRLLATLDARPFIKDGMVNSVYISNNTLVITFNTDAGREAIGVSLSSIFNPNNYYTKTQVNNLLGNYYNKDVIDNLVRDNAALLDDGRLGNLQSSPIVLDGMYWDNDEWPDGVAGDYYKVYHTASRDKHEIVLYKWINDGTVVRRVRVYRDVDPTAIYYDKDSETFYRYDVVEDDFVEIETGSGSGGYEPPVGGIPKSDLSQSVQASLSKADSALQSQEQADWNESDNSDPAFIKNKPTIPDVSNLATKSEVQGKANASDVYTKTEVDYALSLKQGNITDLEQIREGATRGVTAYQKPNNGIPASDLADGVIPDVSGFVTSSDVETAVADLVNSAPATLDTLKELADALGDDPNFATTMTTALGNKVDKVSGKGLSTEDYTTAEKTKLEGLSNYDDTALQAVVAGKVDKETGKSLMTDAERTKLAGIASGAEVNVQADWEQTTTTADDYIKNKPTLATVATSGSYNDLSNKPTIPTVPQNIVQSVSVNGGTAEQPDANGNVDLDVPAGAQGPKGDTGNVQVDGVGNVLIVNDLDQSAAGAALDASQGKRLKGIIVSLATLVNSALEKVAWIDDDGQDIIDDIQDIVDELTAPIIYTDLSSLSFVTTTGTAATKTIKVHGGNLTADISLSVSGTGFSIDKNSVGKNDGETIVTATYNPSSTGTNTGSIVLSSTGATSVTVSLSGEAVAGPSIGVNVNSLSLSSVDGATVTNTFKVTPINLSNDITLAVSGTGFSIDKQTISKDAGETTVTVTYSPTTSGTDTGAITIESVGVSSKTVSLSGTSSILTAVFSSAKQIYTSDTLDWLKQFVTVEDGGVAVSVSSWVLSGTLTVGTSTLTATYNNRSVQFTVSNVLAGVASFYDFVNNAILMYRFPTLYSSTNNKRSIYPYMDKHMAGGVAYTFIAECNYNTTQYGFIFYNQAILDAYEGSYGITGTGNVWDSTWKSPGDAFTPDVNVNNSPIVGVRINCRASSANIDIPNDFLIERVVLIEVQSN